MFTGESSTSSNPIPEDVHASIQTAMEQGKTLSEALLVVRQQLVPSGYAYEKWRAGAPETQKEVMQSIFATYRFREELDILLVRYKADFKHHMYVPEVDPITGEIYHAREDHNHIVKRIAHHTRKGGPGNIKVKRFQEAMESDTNDLTLAALVGKRKQSVADAESLLSPAVASFFESKNYTREAEYVRIISQWHEASDGRGMTQEERKEANMNMFNYIVEGWIPWYDKENPDFSTLDINRYVDS